MNIKSAFRFWTRSTYVFGTGAAALVLTACTELANNNYPGSTYEASITRTAGGIPHIVADDWGSLGFATLYAMAEDNICLMAAHYQMMAAEQSLYAGPEEGRVESDFFYQLLNDRALARQPLNAKLDDLFAGAAAGYNHYLKTTGVDELPDQSCRGAEWVKPVRTIDVKRISRIDIFLDYLKPIIVAAKPPVASPQTSVYERVIDEQLFAARVAEFLEVPKQGGSNAIAIGKAASASGAGMLLANPHVSWHEMFFRFYPMHQTIPGELDIIGANMVGRPRVGFGATRDIAWSNTVSKAKRMSFYRLQLVPGKPDHYLFDGSEYPMTQEQVSVKVRNSDGTIETRSHTFYSTHFGAMLVKSPIFDWNAQFAFAVKTIDVGWRGELSAFAQYNAKTVRELHQVHKDYQFMTVNLIAVDRDGEALYAEPGPVPLLDKAQLQDCEVMRGAALDGSRSACMWGSADDAVVEGVYGPSSMPFLYRDDYVTNSNDSYWLANPAEPLDGVYPSIIGSQRSDRTLRTRSGLAMMEALLAEAPIMDKASQPGSSIDQTTDSKIDLSELMQLMYGNENYAGQIVRDDLVRFCQQTTEVTVDDRKVDLGMACQLLANWDLRSNNDSVGSHLFREFLAALNDNKFVRYLPKVLEPRIPFDLSQPVNTPSGIADNSKEQALKGLAQAVIKLEQNGVAIDAPLGDVQYVTRNDRRIPIHGGQEIEGVFNKVESDFVAQQGYPEVTRWSTSWILAADYGEEWPEVKGLLAYSISGNPESPHYADQTEIYSSKDWLDLPFSPANVRAAAVRRYTVKALREQ